MRQTPGATASEVSLITGHFGYPGSSPKRNALSSSTRDAKIEEAQQVLGLGQALPPELLAAKPKRLRFLIFNRAGRSCTMPARWCAGCGIWARRFAAGEPPCGASLTPPCLRTATLTDGLSRTIFPASGASVLQTAALPVNKHRSSSPRSSHSLSLIIEFLPDPCSPRLTDGLRANTWRYS